MKRAFVILSVIFLAFSFIGCASDGEGKPDIDVTKISPAKATAAGMTFAMIAPERAAKMSKSCSLIVALTDKESLREFILNRLTEQYFENMTEAQAVVVKNFIFDIARDVGISIDLDLGIVDFADDFDLGGAKDIIRAVCAGIVVGLEAA